MRGKKFNFSGILGIFAIVFTAMLLCCAFPAVVQASPAGGGKTPVLGVDEGWAWPVIVIPPPEGWDSPVGESIKSGMRVAEREISNLREGIRGREVTFMFSSISDTSELEARVNTWRGMKAAVIVSFAEQGMNNELMRLCAGSGPCVIFAGGEDIAIKDPSTGMPFRYLFALDLPYFARANALAEFASVGGTPSAAVITDQLSPRLAKGADENIRLLKNRGVDAFSMFVSGMTVYQFSAQVQTAEASGAVVISSWLDSMSTLSIWRTASMNKKGTTVYYPGEAHRFLLDADGLVLVDKDGVLNINEEGKWNIISKCRDALGKSVEDPVTAAKAFALAKWTIDGHVNVASPDAPSLSLALSTTSDIPLMDERLTIDSRTNRPETRKYGVLRVRSRRFVPAGSVDVHSAETAE